MILNRLLLLSILVLIGIIPISTLRADIPVPMIIRVLFEQNGNPYDAPLVYTIECLGWRHSSETDNLVNKPKEIVQSISAECPGYDCKKHYALYNNPRFTTISRCDMKVRLWNEQTFTIENYSDSPVINRDCKKLDFSADDRDPLYECILQFEVP